MAIGLMVAIPIGPMGLLCIQRTLAYGRGAGLATGFGAATVHLTFGSIAALGLDAAMGTWVKASSHLLSMTSAALLFWFAARILRRSVTFETRNPPKAEWFSLYASSLVYGLTNPITILLFAAALPAMTMANGRPPVLPLVGGVFLGSASWWVLLSLGVGLVRHRISPAMLALTNAIAGLALAALGMVMLVGTVQQLLQ
jgi:threonine/homoserine/homoserine lactone efflux protein